MSREVWVWDEIQQKVVLREERTPRPSKTAHVISDSMPMLKHMGTGRYSDSKSQFRAMTKASGAIEAGNDPAITRSTPKDVQPITDYVSDVKRAMQEVNSR